MWLSSSTRSGAETSSRRILAGIGEKRGTAAFASSLDSTHWMTTPDGRRFAFMDLVRSRPITDPAGRHQVRQCVVQGVRVQVISGQAVWNVARLSDGPIDKLLAPMAGMRPPPDSVEEYIASFADTPSLPSQRMTGDYSYTPMVRLILPPRFMATSRRTVATCQGWRTGVERAAVITVPSDRQVSSEELVVP